MLFPVDDVLAFVGAMSGNSKRATVFISYRRGRTDHFAGRIYDNLCWVYGKENVFLDIDNIPAGSEFVAHIVSYVQRSDVMLAIIGPDWISKAHKLEPHDFIRIEVEAAIRLGVVLIPILVDGAEFPAPERIPESMVKLLTHNAVKFERPREFAQQFRRLVAGINVAPGRIVESSVSSPKSSPPKSKLKRRWKEAVEAERRNRTSRRSRLSKPSRVTTLRPDIPSSTPKPIHSDPIRPVMPLRESASAAVALLVGAVSCLLVPMLVKYDSPHILSYAVISMMCVGAPLIAFGAGRRHPGLLITGFVHLLLAEIYFAVHTLVTGFATRLDYMAFVGLFAGMGLLANCLIQWPLLGFASVGAHGEDG